MPYSDPTVISEESQLEKESVTQKLTEMTMSTTSTDPETVSIKYLYVPADNSKPIEERVYKGPNPELGADGFVDNLKAWFSDKKNIGGTDIDKSKLIEGLTHHAGKEQIEKLTPEMMNKILNTTQLDIFPALLPTPQTKQRGISIYVDDKGVSKNLQMNQRLTSLCQELGYVQQCFVGDGFIGRVHDSENDDIWKREDFTLSEMNSDSDWCKLAKDQVKNKKSLQEVQDFKKQFMGKNGTGPAVEYNAPRANAIVDVTEGVDKIEEGKEGKECSFVDKGEEIEITFKAEEGSAKLDKKKVVINYHKGKSLEVKYDGKVWFEKADLYAPVDVEDCSWSIVEGGSMLQITLMKKNEEGWPGIRKV